MKKKVVMKLLAGVLVAAMCVTQVPYGEMKQIDTIYAGETGAENLFTDGDFEVGDVWTNWDVRCESWNSSIDSVGTASTGEFAKSGSHSMHIKTKADGKDVYVKTKAEVASIEVGKTYILSGYAKLVSETEGVWVAGTSVTKAEGWKEFSEEYNAQDKWPTIKVWAPSGTDIYLDDLKLVEKPEDKEDGVYYIDEYVQDYSKLGASGWNGTWSSFEAGSQTDEIKKGYWATWTSTAQKVSFTKTFSGLENGKEYKLSFGTESGDINKVVCTIGDGEASEVALNGANSIKFTATEASATIKFIVDFKDKGWCNFKNLKLQKVVTLEEKIADEQQKLKDLIDECKKLTESTYTSDSWSALQTAITEAEKVLAKEDKTDEVLDALQEGMKSVKGAKNALVEIPMEYYIDAYAQDYSTTTDTEWVSKWDDTTGEMKDAVEEETWKIWSRNAQNAVFTKEFSGLEEGTYRVSLLAVGEKITGNVKVGEKATDIIMNAHAESNKKATVLSNLKIAEGETVKVEIACAVAADGWCNWDNIYLQKVVTREEKLQTEKKNLEALVEASEKLKADNYTGLSWSPFKSALSEAKAELLKEDVTPEALEQAKAMLEIAKKNLKEDGVFVKKVENLSEDFMRGVDISSYISIVESGAAFKNANGETLNDQGFFNLLKDSGVNWVRLRVWNDPYTSDGKGNGYGGGNNDLDKAIRMGQWATNAGMKVLIDFHYSDFWADPDRQLVPKAWKNMNISQKEDALYKYTKKSLTALLNAGVDVGMVQVGNETNNGIAGEDHLESWENMCKLFSAGSKAIRDVNSKIQVAVHFTDPQTKGNYDEIAGELDKYEVDYDVFASSYYPNIHGSMENITKVLEGVATAYNKKVMVAETAWANTTKDGDGHSKEFSKGTAEDYAISVQGQVNEVRDVIDAVNKIKDNAGIGVFYWEPTWIPVAYAYDAEGHLIQEIKDSNTEKWEKYGSGWASSYSDEYDHDHGGLYYGGSVKDAEAFFDFEGNPLASLTIFKDVNAGRTFSIKRLEEVVDASAEAEIDCSNPASATEAVRAALPTTVKGIFNYELKQIPVVWNVDEISAITDMGTYTVNGTASYVDDEHPDGATKAVKCSIKVFPNKNYLTNGDFETEDATGWEVAGAEDVNIKWDDTPLRGTGAMHFWSASDMNFTITQTLKADEAGKLCASMQLQGDKGSESDDISITLKNITRGTSSKKNAFLSGWCVWKNPRTEAIDVYAGDTVEVTITIKSIANAWGSVDDVFLYRVGNLENISSDVGGGSSSSTTTQPTDKTETKEDGTVVETKTETKPDGTKVETTTETATDGSKTETVVETKADGTKVETTTETATDGSKVETVKEEEKNKAGNEVAKETVTKTDAEGNVNSVVEKSVIAEIAENTSATVTVKKDEAGTVTAATASVATTIEGKKTSISSEVVSQITEAAGQEDVKITVTAKDDSGKTLYKVKVDANDIEAGKDLVIYKLDSKTGKLVMVNSKTYAVDEDGNLDISIQKKATYELMTKEEAKAVEKEIKASIKVKDSSKTVKKGKSTKVAFDKKMNMDNVKKITYSTADKGIAKVSKDGNITAKGKGTVKIKAKVTLKNGATKTVTMKVKVK